MSEGHREGIEVSAEEERFLRSAFRRFALPYLLLVIVVTGGALVWSVTTAPPGPQGADELQSLVAESAALREAIGSLRRELLERTARSGERLEALEGGLAKLRSDRDGEQTTELAGRLDHAHQRINALEGRLKELAASRAAPAPAAAAPAPARTWPPADPTFDRP